MSHCAMRSPSSPRRPRRPRRGGPGRGQPHRHDRADRRARAARRRRASRSRAAPPRRRRAPGRTDIALQVADAGVNQYMSRLVEDPRYYDHWVDPAEDPRVDPYGAVHAPGTAWTPGVSWTYAAPSQTWTQLQDARFGKAAYSLRITPPPSGSDLVTVQSTGQVGPGGPNPVTRSVQSQIHPTSIADFQIISNATISTAATATTTGKLYSAVDINHQGVATAPAYAAALDLLERQHFGCRELHPARVRLPGRRLRREDRRRHSRRSSRRRSTSPSSPSRCSTSRTRPPRAARPGTTRPRTPG